MGGINSKLKVRIQLNTQLTTFVPGDTLTGIAYVHLDEPIKAGELSGLRFVLRRKIRVQNTIFSALYKNQRKPLSEAKEYSLALALDTFPVPTVPSYPADVPLDFSIDVPSGLVPSMVYDQDSKNAKISYKVALQAVDKRGQPINLKKAYVPINIGRVLPASTLPVTVLAEGEQDALLCGCIKYGSLKMKMKLPSRDFVHDEAFSCEVEITNTFTSPLRMLTIGLRGQGMISSRNGPTGSDYDVTLGEYKQSFPVSIGVGETFKQTYTLGNIPRTVLCNIEERLVRNSVIAFLGAARSPGSPDCEITTPVNIHSRRQFVHYAMAQQHPMMFQPQAQPRFQSPVQSMPQHMQQQHMMQQPYVQPLPQQQYLPGMPSAPPMPTDLPLLPPPVNPAMQQQYPPVGTLPAYPMQPIAR